ncbi:MAG: tRNA (adenosine(37)-N6)-dimethylallyltransferase MiaA [Gemmatimonadetes bacterium]|nr:tRNA (adenosine(37)-N6)-dimethylallyltransferase MiaA [Gemmatimonadota bacterium]|tara:strand:+ start:4559 stop:5464 length:906 start_codon:yes stop_codon:yes gene_type:complete
MDLIVIAGPTASGKTAVGIEVARALNGEIISVDARQVYRHMNIGTAKPTPSEQAAVPHHLIDIVDPDEMIDAADYARRAADTIEQILGREKLPVLVGGAGFYLEALFSGFSPIPAISEETRARVQGEADFDLQGCHARLARVDPCTASRLQPTDRQRVTRALEVFDETGTPISTFQAEPRQPPTRRSALWIGLQRERDELYERIDRRAESIVDHGLLEEVENLVNLGYGAQHTALKTFGYAEFLEVVAGQRPIGEAIQMMQQSTRRYAKRQISWFRNRCPDLQWYPAERAPRQIVTDFRVS